MDVRHREFLTVLVVSILCRTVCSQSSSSTVMYGPCAGSSRCSRSSNAAHDLILGGIFPLRNVVCDGAVSLDALQWATAMDEAVTAVNQRQIISSADGSVALTLGYELRDTCRQDTVALQEVLSFLQGESTTCASMAGGQGRPVGVVGPFSSSVSIRVTRLLQLFNIPMISFGSTSPQLSNKATYPYFLRTLPSDIFLARAIVRAARQRGWSFINLVHTGDAFGRDGSASVQVEARAAGICIASVTEVRESAVFNNTEGLADYGRAWRTLLDESPQNKSVVTVLFVQETNAREFFLFGQHNTAIREAALQKNITFLGVDSWGDILSAVRDSQDNPLSVAIGAVSPIPFNQILEDFDIAFGQLKPDPTEPDNNQKNPWLSRAWGDTFSCNPSQPSCITSNSFTSRAGYVQSSKVAMVYDAVYAFAYALRSILRNSSLCPLAAASCSSLRNGRLLLQTLQALSFPGINSNPFRFNKNGDPLASIYAEKNMVVSSANAVSFPTVGIYSATETSLNSSSCQGLPDFLFSDSVCYNVSFNGSVGVVVWNDGSTDTPVSICTRACLAGQSRMVRKSLDANQDLSCCWTCSDCQNTMFSNQTNADSCLQCQTTESVVTNSILRNIACSLLPLDFYDIKHPLALVVAAISALSMIAVFSMLVLQISWWDGDKFLPWPIRVLPTAVSLVGIFILLLSGQLFVIRPTPTVCSINFSIATAGLTLALVPLILYVWDWYSTYNDVFNEAFTESSSTFKQAAGLQTPSTNAIEAKTGVAREDMPYDGSQDELDRDSASDTGQKIPTLKVCGATVDGMDSEDNENEDIEMQSATGGLDAEDDQQVDRRMSVHSQCSAVVTSVTQTPAVRKQSVGISEGGEGIEFHFFHWLKKMLAFILLYGVLLTVALVIRESDVSEGVTAHVTRTLTCADSGALLFGFGWLLVLLLILLASATIAAKSIHVDDNSFEADIVKSVLFSDLICVICVVACTSVYTASPKSVIRNGSVSLCLCLVSLSLIGVIHAPRFYYILRHRSNLQHKYEDERRSCEVQSMKALK